MLLPIGTDSLSSRAGSPRSGHPLRGPSGASEGGVASGAGHSPWGGMPLPGTGLVPDAGCGFTRSQQFQHSYTWPLLSLKTSSRILGNLMPGGLSKG